MHFGTPPLLSVAGFRAVTVAAGKGENIMRKIIGMLFAGLLAVLGTGGAAHATTYPGPKDGPCLGAAGPTTYRICEALRVQPPYFYRHQGETVRVPDGWALLAELKAGGITPSKNSAKFRSAARNLVSDHFRHVEDSPGVTCAESAGPITYEVCSALVMQPSYSYKSGSKTFKVASGQSLMKSMSGELVRPNRNADTFRDQGRGHLEAYFARN